VNVFKIGRAGLVLAVAVALMVVVGARASSPEPGSAADPLVSRSYVDEQVGLRIVVLEPGQVLECAAGTEIILRTGQAVAVGSEAGGLSDVTEGRDVADGERISANHLLIVPRADGRGLRAVTRVIVMVRGAAEVR